MWGCCVVVGVGGGVFLLGCLGFWLEVVLFFIFCWGCGCGVFVVVSMVECVLW